MASYRDHLVWRPSRPAIASSGD